MILKLARERIGTLIAFSKDDERFDDLAARAVGAGDNGRFRDCRMLDQRAFNFKRPDPISGLDNHVVPATDEPEITIGVAIGAVAS